MKSSPNLEKKKDWAKGILAAMGLYKEGIEPKKQVEYVLNLVSKIISQSFNEGYLKALEETKKAVEDFDPTDMSGYGSGGAGMVQASMLKYLDSKLEKLRKGK